MKKLPYILLSAILLILSACDDDPGSFIPGWQYDGGDPTATYDNYRLARKINYSDISSDKHDTVTDYEYDASGNTLKESSYDTSGRLFIERVYEYSNGKKIKMSVYDGLVDNLTLGSYTTYTYEGDNLVAEDIYLSNGLWKQAYIYEYSNGLLMRKYRKELEEPMCSVYQYTYDSHGRVITEAGMFDDNPEVASEWINHHYDKEGLNIQSDYYTYDDGLTHKVKRVFNSKFNKADQELYYDPKDKLYLKITRVFDQRGNIVEVQSNGSPQRQCLYNNELLMEEVVYHPTFPGTIWAYTKYEYEKIK